ncbi:MAG: HNH endonuclease [Chloroflexi bacterium]|nr:HNH endonuclease [Chloroflexota bacterium]
MSVLDYLALVLNQNYEPLNVCNIRRAIVLVQQGKAEILENGRGDIRSVSSVFTIPSVIRLQYHIRRPLRGRKLTRREVFLRDRFTCQYCGKVTRELTLDHVIPRNRGGRHTWDNMVAACVPCNHRKAAHTPPEARMRLLKRPAPPPLNPYQVFYPYLHTYQEWQKFVPYPEGWLRGPS